jgi:hypothetical protein
MGAVVHLRDEMDGGMECFMLGGRAGSAAGCWLAGLVAYLASLQAWFGSSTKCEDPSLGLVVRSGFATSHSGVGVKRRENES